MNRTQIELDKEHGKNGRGRKNCSIGRSTGSLLLLRSLLFLVLLVISSLLVGDILGICCYLCGCIKSGLGFV
jgi:hypothetical protein